VAAVGDPAQAAINVDLGKIAAAQSYLAQTGMVDRLRGWGNQLTVDADDALNAENPPVPSIVAPWVAWLKALRTLGTEAKAGSLTLTAEQAVKSTTTALRNAVTTAGF
jgi:hypothetical protein